MVGEAVHNDDFLTLFLHIIHLCLLQNDLEEPPYSVVKDP